MLDQFYNDRLYGSYLNMTFADVYPSVEVFVEDAKGIAAKLIPTDFTDDSLEVLYYLLLARYANNSIASSDVNRFKLNLFAIVYQHGGVWQKKVSLQEKIRLMTDTEARTGSREIDNHAYNPAVAATSTQTLDELPYIDRQTSRGYKKSLLETYAEISSLMEENITEDFIERFKKLFLWVVSPQRPLWYITAEEDIITNENL